MNGALSGIVSVLTAIVGVAALAVIFAPQAKSASVIQAGGGAFADALKAAEAPVLGAGIGVALRPLVGQN